MSWWTKHRKYANPIKLVEKGIHELNQAVGWNEPGDGPKGVEVSAHYNTAIDENMINQNYASQELAKIDQESKTYEEYANKLQEANYISQAEKDKALQISNGGTTMANTATNQQEQNWFERNSEYIMPLLSTALTTAAQMYYNDYQQDKQNSYNAEQAQINRNWQEQMSNTAITRQVQDLQNAGINPLLASQLGGSAVTSGGQASSAGLMPMNMRDIAATAKTSAEIQNMQADSALKWKQSGKSEAETKSIEIDNQYKDELMKLEMAYKEATTEKERNEIKKVYNEAHKIEKELRKMDEEIEILKSEGKIKEAEAKTRVRNRRAYAAIEMTEGITRSVGNVMGAVKGTSIMPNTSNINANTVNWRR